MASTPALVIITTAKRRAGSIAQRQKDHARDAQWDGVSCVKRAILSKQLSAAMATRPDRRQKTVF